MSETITDATTGRIIAHVFASHIPGTFNVYLPGKFDSSQPGTDIARNVGRAEVERAIGWAIRNSR